MGGLPHNFRKLSSHSVIRNGQLLCGGPPEPSPVPAPAPPTPRARTLPPTTPIPTTTPEATPTQTPVPSTRENPLSPQKCGGTFVGLDGNTYTCQHAIDEGWAKNCAEVSGWTNAQCVVDTAAPITPTPTPEPTHSPTPAPPTRGSPLHPQKCGGTFVGSDGSTYTCQHAIDNGWARNCAVVSGWTNAQCFVDTAVPVKPTPPAPTRVAATAQVSPDPCSAS